MKRLYKRFDEIEAMIRRGLITLREGNELMINAIHQAADDWSAAGCPGEWDTQRAYHKMYLILAKLTRD